MYVLSLVGLIGLGTSLEGDKATIGFSKPLKGLRLFELHLVLHSTYKPM